jgi:hypothetical protein
MRGEVTGPEDCLTVNVWAPPNAKGLPVMVFLHGGRHMVGGALGGQISFDGARLAEEARVVVFSIEFRFGLLGYLTHPALDADAGPGRSGNYGMLDQLLGLQWVRENARAFGGEAEQVTVFGQSSGSTDIALLLAAPRARGLFHRAILDSVPRGAAVDSRARALEVGQKTAQAAGCNGPEAASCLRTVSTEQLLKSAASAGPVFAPHVDGALFPVAPLEAFATGAYAHMPILLGTARDEQAYFRPDVPDAARYEAMMREEFPKVAEQALAFYPVSKHGTPAGLRRELRMRQEAERPKPVVEVTRTTPFFPRFSPSLCLLEPPPSEYASPKIHTMTGCRSPTRLADVQTLRYRQSSLVFGESGRSTVTLFGDRFGCDGCTQTLPNCSALRTPSHFAGGCGAFQRSSPIGGAANGTPLKALTPDWSVTPEIRPVEIATGSDIAAGVVIVDVATMATAIVSATLASLGL